MPQCWSISQACTLWYLDRDRLDRERASKLYHVPWALILERSSFNYFGCIDWIRLSFPSHVLWMEVQDGTWIDIGVLVRFWLILLRRHLRTCGGLSPRTRFLHEVINMMTSCRRRACFAFRQLRNQSFLDSVISLPSFCYLVLIGLSHSGHISQSRQRIPKCVRKALKHSYKCCKWVLSAVTGHVWKAS